MNANKNLRQYKKLLETLDFESILEYLNEEEAVTIELKAIGSKMEKVIIQRDLNKCLVLAREFYEFKPSKLPVFKIGTQKIIKETVF